MIKHWWNFIRHNSQCWLFFQICLQQDLSSIYPISVLLISQGCKGNRANPSWFVVRYTLGKSPIYCRSNIHTYGQFRVSSLPNLHVFWQWDITGVLEANPHRHWENMQTLHWKGPSWLTGWNLYYYLLFMDKLENNIARCCSGGSAIFCV